MEILGAGGFIQFTPIYRLIRVLNTAAIKVKGQQWTLTSLFDLCRAGLLPGAIFDQERPNLSGYLKWNRHSLKDRFGIHEFTNFASETAGTSAARNALDHVHDPQNGISYLSRDEPFKCSDINDKTRGLQAFIEFLVGWESYYADLDSIRKDEVEFIHILTFEPTSGLPWERGEAMEDSRIKLTSVGPFDLPLGNYDDNIGYIESVSGNRFSFCTALCLVEVLTDIFKTERARVRKELVQNTHSEEEEEEEEEEERICVRSIRGTLRRGAETLFNAARLHCFGKATLTIYRSRYSTQERQSLASSHISDEVKENLRSILTQLQTDSELQKREGESWQFELQTILKSLDKEKLAMFLLHGILFTHEDAALKAVLVANTSRHRYWSRQPQSGKSSFRIANIYKDDIFRYLRKQVDVETESAFQKFESMKADGDGAKGRIGRWLQRLSWIYVLTVVILSILAVALNWRDADSIWERAFGGVEFSTFALVGVFGLLKLVGEDQNAIRNTFLGYVKLRTEDDVVRYTGTQNVPLALALSTKGTEWANGAYTCYAMSRTYGGIAILSGLDIESAPMAGIYPIREDVAVDLRTGKLRTILKDEGTDQEVFRLGGPVPSNTEVNPICPVLKGVFRGPS